MNTCLEILAGSGVPSQAELVVLRVNRAKIPRAHSPAPRGHIATREVRTVAQWPPIYPLYIITTNARINPDEFESSLSSLQ